MVGVWPSGGRASGWAETHSEGHGQSRSPAGEAVGRGHHPARVDETACTEAVPDVDGGQPGVGARQGRRAPDDAWPEEAPLLVPLATGLASHWGRLSLSQHDLRGPERSSGEGFWEHRSPGHTAGAPSTHPCPEWVLAAVLTHPPPHPRQLCPHRHTIYSLSLSFLFCTMGRTRPNQSPGFEGSKVVWHVWQGFLSLPATWDLRAQAGWVAPGAWGPEGRLASRSCPLPGSGSRGGYWPSHPIIHP